MRINLSWDNRNANEEGTRIYKSDAFISSSALPAALAVLPPGAATYADLAVVRNKTYHYRIEIFRGADTTLSQNIAAVAVPYTGPGAQELISGDFERGYFGTVDPFNFISYDALSAAFPTFTEGIAVTAAQLTSVKWLKFAHKGKILFVAHNPIRHSVSWLALYNRGLVYGVDGPGAPGISGLAAINQKQTVTIGGNTYLVRLLTGKPTGHAGLLTVNGGTGDDYAWDVKENMTGSEWDELVVSATSQKPSSFKGESLGLISYKTMWPTPLGSGYSTTICQEVTSAGGTTMRGGAANVLASHPQDLAGSFLSAAHNAGSITVTTMGSNSVNYLNTWRPVLELIG